MISEIEVLSFPNSYLSTHLFLSLNSSPRVYIDLVPEAFCCVFMLVLHRTMEATEFNHHYRDGYKAWEVGAEWLGGIAGCRTQFSGLLNQSFLHHLLQGGSDPPLSWNSPNVHTIFYSWPHLTPLADPSLLAATLSPSSRQKSPLATPTAQNAPGPNQVLTAVTLSTAFCCRGCLARLICLLASHGCKCQMPRISLLSYLTSYCNEFFGIFI